MNQILIKVHSFTDSLSNSSSESYISCSTQTISTIKQIINNILKLSGSEKVSDDYFTLELATQINELYERDDEKVIEFIKTLGVSITEYGEFCVTASQAKQIKDFISKNELDSSFESQYENSDRPSEDNILVTIKDGLDENNLKIAKNIAKAIQGLMGTYSVESYYN